MIKKTSPIVVVLCGPTASGKTQISLELAGLLNAEIISADSRQVYKGLDIGTGKVADEERKKIPHHMLDIARVSENFNVYNYQKIAYEKINEIFKRGKNVLIVGGTGLYIKAVTRGLNLTTTGSDETYREKLKNYIEKHTGFALYQRLKKIDPDYARKIHPNDTLRIIRALEVYKKNKVPFSKSHNTDMKIDSPVYSFALRTPREKLYEKINKRVENMLKEGFIQEVNKLIKLGYKKNLVEKKIIGYRELIQHLDGKFSLKDAEELIKKNTRNYAKRQLTWFKKDSSIKWIDINYKSYKDIAREIKNSIIKIDNI